MSWISDLSANRFNNTYFRDAHGTGFAVDMSGDLVVRGNVGIGETNPENILHVRGNGPQLLLEGQTNEDAILRFSSGPSYGDKYHEIETKFYALPGFGSSNKMHFKVNNGGQSNSPDTRMTIVGNGNVGIGTSSPRKTLEVECGSNGCLFSDSGANSSNALTSINGWTGNGIILGPGVYDSVLYFYARSTNGAKYKWEVAGAFLFTGQHLVYSENMNLKTNLSDHVGLIISSSDTGYTSYYNDKLYTGKEAIRSCEALPNCKLTSIEKDKSVFGVITNQENDKYFDTDGNDIYDNVDNGFERNIKDRLRVNSVGEGAIWICNKNGNFDNGDYITSSSVPGYGVKQDDDILHNYTVAKITMSCDFNPQQVPKQKILQHETTDESGNTVLTNMLDDNGELQRVNQVDENGNIIYQDSYEIRYLDLQGARLTKAEYDTKLANGEQVYIAAYVGCTYHCG